MGMLLSHVLLQLVQTMISLPSSSTLVTTEDAAVIASGIAMLCPSVPLTIGSTGEAGSTARPLAVAPTITRSLARLPFFPTLFLHSPLIPSLFCFSFIAIADRTPLLSFL